MSTEPIVPGTPTGTTETPSTTAPISGNPGNGNGPAPEAWRPGPNAPSWAQGRTQEEILNIAALAVDQLAKFNQHPAPIQTPSPQAPNRFDLDSAADEDFLSVRQARQMMAAAQQGDPVARQLAISNNMRTIRQAEADAFRRWGAEIEAHIAGMPPEIRTLDNLQLIVNMVRGTHVQELVEEQSRQKAAVLAQEQVATIRSGAGGSTTIPNTQNFDLTSNDLPEHWRDLASKQGLTMDAVREFCHATGESMESYFETVKKYGKGAVVHG